MALKIGNFLFPQSDTPEDDTRVIDETLEEARLCDALGMEALWLAEHHFDGMCAYVDPVSFAASLATATRQIKIGFAVAQMSLHHPIRMAEQLALIDNITKGRLIVGLGRGTAYNIYDYRGYGIAPEEAQDRLIEAEEVMRKAWTTPNLEHHGTYFDIDLPRLRPEPYTKPHPFMIRACSGEESTLEMARQGRPFLMNVQPVQVMQHRLQRYRETMREAGYGEGAIADNLSQCWGWRNVVVAETDAEAERVAPGLFAEMREARLRMRAKWLAEKGETLEKQPSGPAAPGGKPMPHNDPAHSLICGSPSTVAAKIAEIEATGIGGLIIQFRVGPMPWEMTERSIRLFMEEVAPIFRPLAAAE